MNVVDFCLACQETLAFDDSTCRYCRFPVSEIPDDLWPHLPRDSSRQPEAAAPAAIVDSHLNWPLPLQQPMVVGAAPSIPTVTECIANHKDIAQRHFAIVPFDRDRGRGHFLLHLGGDLCTTYVNGKPCLACVLTGGDLIQAGPYGWTYATNSGRLSPVFPLDGRPLRLENVSIEGRLSIDHLLIPAGQMVAIVGPSGAGKSTLIKEIAERPTGTGDIVLGNLCRDEHPDEFRRAIAYVPQEDITHSDLTAGDQVRYVSLLSGCQITNGDVERAFWDVGLTRADMDKFPRQLSGGQLKRVQLASALLRNPGVMLLDEPDSGLDPERSAEIFSLLRGFAVRGATVVAISHAEKAEDHFDRIIRLKEGGEVESDSAPAEEATAEEATAEEVADKGAADEPHPAPRTISLPSRGRHLQLLLQRDFEKLTSRRTTAVLTALVVPVAFAAAVALAVPNDRLDLLGLLGILSVIWMSASLSHLSIATEKTVYDYERTQFLQLAWYLLSRSTVLTAFAGVQSTVFFAALAGLRLGDNAGFFHEWPWCLAILWLLAGAAVNLGLAISSWSIERPPLAAALLPLLMMLQVVFSEPVTLGEGRNVEVGAVYGQLHLEQCDGIAGCPHRSLTRYQNGDWLCDACANRLEKGEPAFDPRTAVGGVEDANRGAMAICQGRSNCDQYGISLKRRDNGVWLCKSCYRALKAAGYDADAVGKQSEISDRLRASIPVCQGRKGCPGNPQESVDGLDLCGNCYAQSLNLPRTDPSRQGSGQTLSTGDIARFRGRLRTVESQRGVPSRLVGAMSVMTLTRYADQALRSFAYRQHGSPDAGLFAPGRWSREAGWALLVWSLLGWGMAWTALRLRELRADRRRRVRWPESAQSQETGPLTSNAQKSKVLSGCLLLGLVTSSLAEGSEPAAARPKTNSPIHIELDPNGQYDESELRRQLNDVAELQLYASKRPRLRWLSSGDKTALLLLQAAGAIKNVDISARHFSFDLGRGAAQKIAARLAPARLELPPEAATSDRIMVLVHGLESSGQAFDRFATACRATNIVPLLYEYPNDGSVSYGGSQLLRHFNRIHEEYPELRLVVVAHSMGGLVARYAIDDPAMPPELVTDLFLIATPHLGSSLAGGQPMLDLFLRAMKFFHGEEVKWDFSADGQGEAARELTPGSDLLGKLNGRQFNTNVRRYLAAGTVAVINESQRARILGQLEKLALPPAQAEYIHGVLSGDEIIHGKGDSAVTIASAFGVVAKEKQKFSLSHNRLISLPGPSPEESDVFSWIVRVLDWAD